MVDPRYCSACSFPLSFGSTFHDGEAFGDGATAGEVVEPKTALGDGTVGRHFNSLGFSGVGLLLSKSFEESSRMPDQ
jgi:hypothetical protein